ncbi:MAG: ABC transporter permease subunit [Gammaproteobacteria bacterium]|nr:ABC transporter permease subunit [Gammaproteobacteria bacterium]
MFLQRFLALLRTRNKEFLRDRSSVSWNIIMPVLIVLGFAFTFTGDFADQYKVGIANDTGKDLGLNTFRQTKYIEFIPINDISTAIVKVERHQLDMLIDASTHRYWVNNESPKGYLVERIMRDSLHDELRKQVVTGKQIRYVDWVIPGILSMNMMFSALFGVGYVIVRYRKNGMLKRLQATPVTAFEYLGAQIVSRLLLIMAITIFIFYGTNLIIGYAMYGSHLNLFLVFALGAINLISLGLIIAARARSEETAGGLLNLLTWPMMFLSGVWFSLEGTNPIMQKIAEVLPLTHVTAAARAIMIDGAGLGDISYHLIVLLVQTVIFLIIGALLFRWE